MNTQLQKTESENILSRINALEPVTLITLSESSAALSKNQCFGQMKKVFLRNNRMLMSRSITANAKQRSAKYGILFF